MRRCLQCLSHLLRSLKQYTWCCELFVNLFTKSNCLKYFHTLMKQPFAIFWHLIRNMNLIFLLILFRALPYPRNQNVTFCLSGRQDFCFLFVNACSDGFVIFCFLCFVRLNSFYFHFIFCLFLSPMLHAYCTTFCTFLPVYCLLFTWVSFKIKLRYRIRFLC